MHFLESLGKKMRIVDEKSGKVFVRFKIMSYLCTRKSEMMAG